MRPLRVKDGTVKENSPSGIRPSWDTLRLSPAGAHGRQDPSPAPRGYLHRGELGERKVEKGGLVIVGPPTVFNAANIDKYDFCAAPF